MSTLNYKNKSGKFEELAIIINDSPKTAYDLAIESGFVGTMDEWLKSLAYDDTNLNKKFDSLNQDLDIHKVNVNKDVQAYKDLKDVEINKSLNDYKSSKDSEISKSLEDYKIYTTENIDKYKDDKSLEINKSFDDYKDKKDLEINNFLYDFKIINAENSESNYITIEDTEYGNITNIEIFGNTVQDSTNLADIQSTGTLQEDGRYKVSILSCGKNLFNGKTSYSIATKQAFIFAYPIKPNKDYTLSLKYTKGTSFAILLSNTYDEIIPHDSLYSKVVANGKGKELGARNTNKLSFNSENYKYMYVTSWVYDLNGIDVYDIQLEVGTVATTYEKFQCNKSSILLPCQLEKVGTISDRLFRREDGVWYIEKNIGEVILKGIETWSLQNSATVLEGTKYFQSASFSTMFKPPINNASKYHLISNFNVETPDSIWNATTTKAISINTLGIIITRCESQTVDEFKNKLANSNIIIKTALATPQIIELPLDAQIQLNSFTGTTNIFTEDTVIEPTIKATVPKSLGASVNSLVNKTDNLSHRVEAVEKLKEGSELEVSTESGYVVCENTNNGQIEGLKIEGKTLVNLSEINSKTVSYGNTSTYKTSLSKIKTNTKYTIILNIKSNTLSPANSSGYVGVYNETGIGTTSSQILIPIGFVGIKTLNITTPSDLSGYSSLTHFRSYAVTTSGSMSVEEIILEGDHTQNPPSYFEGLKSVGEGVDKIEVLSCGKNLFDNKWQIGSLVDTNGNTNTAVTTNINSVNYLKVDSNAEYEMIYLKNPSIGNRVCFYTESKSFIGQVSNVTEFVTPSNCSYIRFTISSTNLNEKTFYIIKSEKNSKHKKQILYQNSDGVYEKPVLRSTGTISDTIEKHSDGKYYFHKRCGEIVFDGSSDESWSHDTGNSSSIIGRFSFNNIGMAGNRSSLISDKYNLKKDYTLANNNIEGMFTSVGGSTLFLDTLYSKLSSQNATDFKTWLQSNPVTVVYQLATEEVYECVNLDLDSYESETSVIVDSGVISPKLTFKIASHIGNTIKVLKDRIIYLEDKVIGMLKNILAGDVQSLAYELYPEDFENGQGIISDEIELL